METPHATIKSSNWRNRYGILLLSLVIIMLGLMALNPLALNVDSALYLEVGRYLLDGRVPYVDYIELNPPLIHYINVLPVFLGNIFNINPIITYKILVLAVVAYACLMSYGLLQRSKVRNNLPIALLLPSLILFATLLDFPDFGQRDHLISLVLIPWLIVRTGRYDGDTIGRGQALLIGFLAAIGIALRPYFVVPLALIEIYYLLKYRQLSHIFRPETLTVMLVGILYIAHFALLPEAARSAFFNDLIPYVQDNYSSYALFSGEQFWLLMNARYLHLIYIFIAGIVLYWGLPHIYRTALMMPLALFAAGAYAVYLYQQLGFSYQAMPFILAVIIIWGIVLQGYWRAFADKATFSLPLTILRPLLIVFVLTSVILIVLLNIGIRILNSPPPPTARIALIASLTEPDDAIFIVDTDLTSIFPMLIQIDRHLDMSYLQAFPIAFGIFDYDTPNDLYGVEPLPDDVQNYLAILADDIEKYEPPLILIRTEECYACPSNFNINTMLQTNGFIDQYLSMYDILESGTLADFMIYRRMDS